VGDAEAEEAAASASAGASASSSAAGGSGSAEDDEESSFAIRSTSRNVYYYVNDEVGSRFADAFPKEAAGDSGKGSSEEAADDEDDEDDEHVANFALVPLFFVPQQIAYTLCWPLRRVGEFARCRHAARLPLNDFSRMEYWDARFKVEGKNLAYDWYFDFATVKQCTSKCRDCMRVCLVSV
jgi:hypothetical protein